MKKIAFKFLYKFFLFIDNLKIESMAWKLMCRGKGTVIGRGTILIYPQCISISDNTWLGENCYLRGGGTIKIGKGCHIAANVTMVTTNHIIDGVKDFDTVCHRDISIGDGCWIGTGAVILPGVSIGNRCVIAANTVVTKTFNEDGLVLVGSPAKVSKRLENAN